MVRIRLRRTGAKKQPHYRVVVAPKEAARDGRFLEIVGHYNPRTEPPTVEIKRDRVQYWLDKGAQPSESVAWMLYKQGLIKDLSRYNIKVYGAKEAVVEDTVAVETPAPSAEEPEVTANVEGTEDAA